MVRRSFSDPASMVGASPEEVLAMKPPGWLVRPHPAGRAGYRMISPGNFPGAMGAISYHGASTGWRRFDERPSPRIFVLNSAFETPMLVDVLRQWASPASTPGAAVADVPKLATATVSLVRDGSVVVYEDDLHGDLLNELSTDAGVAAVRDPNNWWRTEQQPSSDPAQSVFVLDITERGRAEIARLGRRSVLWRRR